ncbi:MAG TPA: hypothetical protein VFJ69_08935 [Actinomycetota bacterium]|jgi:hypothetical protein|nr:hypothetical protein [Actinomycetota bacterium]
MNTCEICEEEGVTRPGVVEEFDSLAGYFWVCQEHADGDDAA